MIIKELRIDNFGGIENKIISLNRGLNVIYGENEKGKSRIEAFIKIMLYGFSTKRGKGQGERVKYSSFKGGSIKGELIIEYEKRKYIIKRSFGVTKKEDSSVILDYLTGEEQEWVSDDEPGKSFLEINKSTFEKTLFIGQLAVAFTKDKEEEIMDKITAVFGCSEDEVSVAKALDKIENIKKGLTTTRGVGALDLLRKKNSEIIQERYEAYKLSEKNLEWEQELLQQKRNRRALEEGIEKLQIYKKYLKRSNLQKEYKDIIEYLKKSEELKRREVELESDLGKGKESIDEAFIDELKEENRLYLSKLDRLEEFKEEAFNYKAELGTIKADCEKYKFLELFEDDIKDKIIALKYEQKNLEEKLSYLNKIKNSKELDEKELKNRTDDLGEIILVKDIKNQIEDSLREYEQKLKDIKNLAENTRISKDIEKKIKHENIMKYIGFILLIGGVSISLLGSLLIILGVLGILSGVFLSYKSLAALKKLKKEKKDKDEIDRLSVDINNVEVNLNTYMSKLKINNYRELMNCLKKYSSFKEYEDRVLVRIEEKDKIIDEEDYEKSHDKYNKNDEMIKSFLEISKCDNLEAVLEKINIYEKLKTQLDSMEFKESEREKIIKELVVDIENKESRLKSKLSLMDLDLGNLLDIEIYIREYKEKLKKCNEVHSNLLSMEETYKALLKDRDIAAIKEDLKHIINDKNQYAYESEEEIETEERKKSKELIECEKRIKDIENSIATRLLGKRNIIFIEEELHELEEKIIEGNKKLKGAEMAFNILKDSFEELSRDIGPTLNNSILDNFKYLTEERYGEIKLSDNYEMIVRQGNNLFKGNFLSNGAWDQLYLSLRISFIELLFKERECPIILDDSFVQYDNKRREKALLLINKKLKGQGIVFTCQDIEESLLKKNYIDANFISL
ncbi:AAA family ATPase [Clostridium vincentii]|uniref:Recombination protein F n=1 Tax=Clostridium vincentii TaxID=52704 RepID=A0A2T0B5I4_9CLOT|nr:AAA family ATPase [Clostridium vincentii]PRR79135.1 recombination protein F [Clostridium vincentii]